MKLEISNHGGRNFEVVLDLSDTAERTLYTGAVHPSKVNKVIEESMGRIFRSTHIKREVNHTPKLKDLKELL